MWLIWVDAHKYIESHSFWHSGHLSFYIPNAWWLESKVRPKNQQPKKKNKKSHPKRIVIVFDMLQINAASLCISLPSFCLAGR